MGLRYLGQNTELYTIGQSNKWIGGGSILLASLWIYSYASCRRVLLLELTRAVLSVFVSVSAFEIDSLSLMVLYRN